VKLLEKALITFSDGQKLELAVDDFLIPIVKVVNKEEIYSTRMEPVEMYWHIHDGLIPAIADVICNYDFFFVGHNTNKFYGSKTIVSVEQL
jgi:hypothetical protein